MRLFNRIFIITLLLLATISFADEGMYPLSEIHKLNLKEKGLLLDSSDIFNTEKISLLDGICKINGCSGSFVSSDGLILTNHHCGYGAVQRASTQENDYLQNGFLAKTLDQEIQAKGYTVRITESYKDVSDQVLSAVTDEMDFGERTKAIKRKIKEIVKEAEDQNPGKRADVSEMFIGKTYLLFIYTYLKDIRLVYAPPRSIGNFGGEVDNWMWPRHTGDFTFFRAYTATDGTPAEFAEENVPYHPRRVIHVSPQGVNEEDFCFILGYPGRTYRHRTSFFIAFEKEVRMPWVVDWYQWQIKTLEAFGKNNPEVALKNSSTIKWRSNTEKNYRGKLLGLRRLQWVNQKHEEEKHLQEFIEMDPVRKEKYGSILEEIEAIYQDKRDRAEYELVLDYLDSGCIFRMAKVLVEAAVERPKPDLERESNYMDRNWKRTVRNRTMSLQNYHQPTDKAVFGEMLNKVSNLPENQRITSIDKLIKKKSIDELLTNMYKKTKLANLDVVTKAFDEPMKGVEKLKKDPFIQLAKALYPLFKKQREIDEARSGQLRKLHGNLIDVKKQFLGKEFLPDANGTLRFTYGYIRGYTPRDAVYYHPITTVEGVLEKATLEKPFDIPKEFKQLIKKEDFGRYKHPKLGSVPTAILYNMDTTGGNSGSAVFNAKGELVGVNFDRAFEATINDYAWSEDYSRSIAVDIRYVLWITEKFGKAFHLLEEMGVSTSQ